MIDRVWITTADNPYNYFTDFAHWFQYDIFKGYGTCEYVARVAKVAKGLSDEENEAETEAAIDEIIKFNPSLPYVKIKESTEEERLALLT